MTSKSWEFTWAKDGPQKSRVVFDFDQFIDAVHWATEQLAWPDRGHSTGKGTHAQETGAVVS